MKAMHNGNLLERIFHKKRWKNLKRSISFKGKKVLDIGCNTGVLTFPIENLGAECVGFDLSKKCIALAKKYKPHWSKARFYVADCTNMGKNAKDSSFDIVLLSAVIEHLESAEVKKTIAETWRVLKPGGIVFVLVPNSWHPVVKWDFLREMITNRKDVHENPDRPFTKAMLKTYFKNFEIQRVVYSDFLICITGIFRKPYNSVSPEVM